LTRNVTWWTRRSSRLMTVSGHEDGRRLSRRAPPQVRQELLQRVTLSSGLAVGRGTRDEVFTDCESMVPLFVQIGPPSRCSRPFTQVTALGSGPGGSRVLVGRSYASLCLCSTDSADRLVTQRTGPRAGITAGPAAGQRPSRNQDKTGIDVLIGRSCGGRSKRNPVIARLLPGLGPPARAGQQRAGQGSRRARACPAAVAPAPGSKDAAVTRPASGTCAARPAQRSRGA
jgi:hypothetical protein